LEGDPLERTCWGTSYKIGDKRKRKRAAQPCLHDEHRREALLKFSPPPDSHGDSERDGSVFWRAHSPRSRQSSSADERQKVGRSTRARTRTPDCGRAFCPHLREVHWSTTASIDGLSDFSCLLRLVSSSVLVVVVVFAARSAHGDTMNDKFGRRGRASEHFVSFVLLRVPAPRAGRLDRR